MDTKRVLFMGVLMIGVVWAATMSPLSKRLRGPRLPPPIPLALTPIGSAAGQPAVAQPIAAQPIAAQPIAVQPGSPRRPTATTLLSRDDLARWRQRYQSAWTRDPFFTAAEEEALRAPKAAAKSAPLPPPPSYTVKAILISDAGKVAALDGRFVSEGDPIGDERVVEIRPDGIVLERAGLRRTLTLPGGTTPIAESGSRDRGGRGR